MDERNSRDPHDETASEKPLQEGLDYYVEDGFMVFTAVFLERRGYCCENGCRHCPYGYIAPEGL